MVPTNAPPPVLLPHSQPALSAAVAEAELSTVPLVWVLLQLVAQLEAARQVASAHPAVAAAPLAAVERRQLLSELR